MLIKFTYVDAQTLRSMSEEPAAAGPILPVLSGISISFSNESEYPCAFPIFYGQCDDADTDISGVLAVLTQEEFDAALAHEDAAKFDRYTNEVRGRRNWMLSNCDWTQLVDAPLTEEKKAVWAAYRQALRDITTQEGFPTTVDWAVDPDAPVMVAEAV
jgi:hypothetical protein